MKVLPEALKWYVGDECMPETALLEKLFTFHAFEIEDIERVGEYEVVDVKVLPDRSSDCLCHRGIAHELAALIGKPLVKDPLRESGFLEPKTNKINVTIENTDNCRRFSVALLTNVKTGPSPEWLKKVLEALGQRSINNVVDATNYVMLMLGQPLHAYDAAKFPQTNGVWHFGVRMARDGETVTTLSNETYTLKNTVQLIVEASSDTPVGIAGIKGGKSAEIDASTTTVILEAANFNPQITRKSAQSLRLQTDASKRFENDLPAELTAYGIRECVRLIQEIAGGTHEGYMDVYPAPTQNPPVAVSLSQINSLLGLTLTEEIVEDIFSRLGFTVTKVASVWEVVAPFERTDILIAEDLIAEVGRVHGYEHVASVLPSAQSVTEYNALHYYSEQIRELLLNEGFSEVVTSSFRKKDEIELLNALASDKGCLRSSLRENTRETLDRNMPNLELLGLSQLQVFEIGTVFHKNAAGDDVAEHMVLSFGVRTKQTGYSPKDDVRLEEIVALLESSLGVTLSGATLQGIFECNLSSLIETLPQPSAYAPYIRNNDTLFTPYSQYPFMSRDIALWTPEGTLAENIETLVRSHAGELLVRLSLFDTFTKDSRTSYAFRLIFQSFERTLTSEEVDEIMTKITDIMTGQNYIVR